MKSFRIDGLITSDTAEMVRATLAECQGEEVEVRIASFGGEVRAAVDISHSFSEHGNVTLVHDSFNASAATWLFGAKHIKMYDDCMLYVHCSVQDVVLWSEMNADELRRLGMEIDGVIHDLDQIDRIIAKKYADRTGGAKSADEMLALMKSHPWLSADECLSYGLVDEVLASDAPRRVSRQYLDALACNHIPAPPSVEGMNEPGMIRRVVDGVLRGLRSLLGAAPTEEQAGQEAETTQETDEPIIQNTTMNKNFSQVNALLNVEGVESQDGKVVLTEDQMGTIEDALKNVPGVAVTAPVAVASGTAGDKYADIRRDAVNFFDF